MKKTLVTLVSVVCFPVFQASALVLFSDNFNTATTENFDTAPLDGRLSGTASGETSLRSFGSIQNISLNRLDLDNVGGVRFGEQLARYNWGGLTTGPDILAAGGFTITFDWTTTDNTDNEWIAWKVGTVNDDSQVNDASVDHIVLMRKNGGNERFDNGTNLGNSGIPFPTVNGGGTYPVSFTYNFNSFADGSPVNMFVSVNGVQIVSDSFTWDGNGGQVRMELQTDTEGNFIDNLTVATNVPEPTAGLLGLVGLVAFARRRR